VFFFIFFALFSELDRIFQTIKQFTQQLYQKQLYLSNISESFDKDFR